MQPFCVWYICTLKNMYHWGSNLLTLLLIHLLSSLFLYLQLKFTFKILNTCRAFEQFSTLIFTISIIFTSTKTPMSRQTWYSISKWGNPKEYFYEFFITILSNYIKRDEITSFSFLIKSWMMNSEPKLFESPNINIDFIRVCKL